MASDDFDESDAGSAAAPVRAGKGEVPPASAGRPWLERALLNVRVWFPFLRTPDMKARQVKYRSSDARSGMTWKVGLPRQCYACGKSGELTLRKFNEQIRVFDAPTTILGGTIGGAAVLLLLSVLFLKLTLFVLALFTLAAGSAFQFIRSWEERVKVNVFSCPEHLEDLTPPQVVSYDEDLYVFLPHESLVEPAREELIQSRKKGPKLAPAKAADSPRPAPQGASREEPAPASDESALPPQRPIGTRTELPPLKLAGEEEE